MIYALGLAMSGKKPTMPPRNSSALASDSVLSKRSAFTAVLGCRGCVALRGSWKAWQSASTLHSVHTRKECIVRCGSVKLAAILTIKCPTEPQDARLSQNLSKAEIAPRVVDVLAPSPDRLRRRYAVMKEAARARRR